MNAIGRQTRAGSGRWAMTAALVLTLGVAGCDGLLEVNLPAAVTSEALDDPAVAGILVGSVMAVVECAYSSMAIMAAGAEDNFQEVTGVAQDYSQYDPTPGGGQCDGDAYSGEWLDPLLTARGQGYAIYDQMQGWGSSARLMAELSIYNAITLNVFGDFFCEFTISDEDTFGTLLTPDQVLDEALVWLDRADTHLATAGDAAISTNQGDVASSAQTLADALRARILWSQGNYAAAATVAATVPDGFMGYVLREEGERRRNMIASTQGNGGGVQAAGFVQGPVRLKEATNSYGYTDLGAHPVAGTPNAGGWPNPVPYTGYLDLAVDSEGRAIDNGGFPLTTASTTDVVGALAADTRIPLVIGNTAGGPDWVEAKYGDLSADIPLVNWREMRIIRAQAAGPSAAGVDHINAIRAADGVTQIQGAYRTLVEGSADRYRDMIIEEKRRALWLEARFYATKIQQNEILWFPRAAGDLVNAGASYSTGGQVRWLMGDDEFEINPNLTLADRATGCPPGEAPVGF